MVHLGRKLECGWLRQSPRPGPTHDASKSAFLTLSIMFSFSSRHPQFSITHQFLIAQNIASATLTEPAGTSCSLKLRSSQATPKDQHAPIVAFDNLDALESISFFEASFLVFFTGADAGLKCSRLLLPLCWLSVYSLWLMRRVVMMVLWYFRRDRRVRSFIDMLSLR